ncbi:conserved hypothetical protein [Beggiatoa sp. PS]|nr:conserved hypothetical protein [Beggiatoa sp. PS]
MSVTNLPASSSTSTLPTYSDPYDSRKPLLQLNADTWTIADAFEGTQIFGAIGSGKTSGSGQAIAKAFLKNGFGGLVLTAKTGERTLWEDYCKETGRENDLILFSPENVDQCAFNFMDYELRRSGRGAGQTGNIVTLFQNVLEVANRNQGQQSANQDKFWERTVEQLLVNAIDLLKFSQGTVSLAQIKQIITTAPRSLEQFRSKAWQESSFCFECLWKGNESVKTDPVIKGDFQLVDEYWTHEFPNLAEKTRSIIEISFTSMANSFLRNPMRELFCEKTHLTPECTQNGKIILLDLPTQEYKEMGQYAQVLFKLVWQRASENRTTTRPMFLWADEAQRFVNSHDKEFQSLSARDKRICTVYLTQNLPNYHEILGDEGTKSFLGNLSTKIFHANSDVVTNKYASETIGQSWQIKTTIAEGRHSGSGSSGWIFSEDYRSSSNNGDSTTKTKSEVLEYDVQPSEFSELGKGGHSSPIVEAIFFQSGRVWNTTKKRFMKLGIRQSDSTIQVENSSINNQTNLSMPPLDDMVFKFIKWCFITFFGIFL